MTLSDGSTFIVADDHPLFREALIHAIQNCVSGAEILEADSLATLYEVVEANPDADLLFLDLNMPGVSGFSALAYMRSNHESLPTVIVSAVDDPTASGAPFSTVPAALSPSLRRSGPSRRRSTAYCRAKSGCRKVSIPMTMNWAAKRPGLRLP